jgi:hypothetical protein
MKERLASYQWQKAIAGAGRCRKAATIRREEKSDGRGSSDIFGGDGDGGDLNLNGGSESRLFTESESDM